MFKRLFVAIALDKKSREFFSKINYQFDSKKLNLNAKNNFHITVLFLGSVNEEAIEDISHYLEKVASRVKSFNLSFKEIILAPPSKEKNMVWATFEDSDEYSDLVSNVYNDLKNFTSQKLRTKRIPHITLARFEDNNYKLEKTKERHKDLNFTVREIRLYESKPNPRVSEYFLLKTFALGKT